MMCYISSNLYCTYCGESAYMEYVSFVSINKGNILLHIVVSIKNELHLLVVSYKLTMKGISVLW